MDHPLVTIGLTAFNAEDTVERAVTSAIAQTWRPIEVIAADDCSTDATPDLLRRLAERHPELRVITNTENIGVGANRNRIIDEAQGEYVAFFDDDDVSVPDRIARQIDRIRTYERWFADGAPVICHSARRVIYPGGTERVERTMGEREGKSAPSGLAVAHRILLGTPVKDAYGACPTCSQMARLSTYRSIGGFDPLLRRSEDTDFNIRLAAAGGHFVGISDPLVIQRMTRTPDKSLRDEHEHMMRLLAKHRPIIEEVGQLDFCMRWIEVKHAFLDRRHLAFAQLTASLAIDHPALVIRRMAAGIRNFGLNHRLGRFHNGRA